MVFGEPSVFAPAAAAALLPVFAHLLLVLILGLYMRRLPRRLVSPAALLSARAHASSLLVREHGQQRRPLAAGATRSARRTPSAGPCQGSRRRRCRAKPGRIGAAQGTLRNGLRQDQEFAGEHAEGRHAEDRDGASVRPSRRSGSGRMRPRMSAISWVPAFCVAWPTAKKIALLVSECMVMCSRPAKPRHRPAHGRRRR